MQALERLEQKAIGLRQIDHHDPTAGSLLDIPALEFRTFWNHLPLGLCGRTKSSLLSHVSVRVVSSSSLACSLLNQTA
jgi:hypothetical protein